MFSTSVTARFVVLWIAAAPAVPPSRPESKTAAAALESLDDLVHSFRGGTHIERSTCEGSTTVIELVRTVADIPRHDVDLGKTRLILRAKEPGRPIRDGGANPGGRVLLDEKMSELWECLGYNPRTRRYAVTSVNEHGVKLTMRGFVYVDEETATLKQSVFTRRGMHAVSSLYQPSSGFLALVAVAEDEGGSGVFKLYVLDTDTDRLEALGKPPAPPPLDRGLLRDRDAVTMMWPWDAPECHYLQLDPAIWSFPDPTTLRVSYGRDTVRARAKQRKEQRFDLQRLFRRTP